MPKMKTHSGSKKRFSVTHTGKVKARSSHKRHRMAGKSKRMKSEGRSTSILKYMDAKVILDTFLPYFQKKRRNARKKLRPLASKIAKKTLNKKEA